MQFSGNSVTHFDTEGEVNENVCCLIRTPPPPPTFSVTNIDVINKIKKLKIKKSPGICQITYDMLKKHPTSYIPNFILLINTIFKFSYFPFYWKTVLIVPILKTSKHPDEAIAQLNLINSLSKLTEVSIARQFNDHIQANNIISPIQFWFRKGLFVTHPF